MRISKSLSATLVVSLTALFTAACAATPDPDQIIGDTKLGVTGAVTRRAEARQPAQLGTLRDTAVEPDAVTLTYDGAAPEFAIGDVIVGSEGPGYLRRVTGVAPRGAQVRLATVNAELGDAFERIDLQAPAIAVVPDAPIQLAATDRTTTLTADDGRVYTARVQYDRPTARAASLDLAWELPSFRIVLSDPSGNIAVTIQAEKLRLKKTLTLDFAMHWTVLHLDDLRFILDDQTTYSIDRLSVDVHGQLPRFSKEIPLFESPVLATVPIGPLVFTIGGGVGVGVDALLSAAVELHTTSDISLTTRSRRGLTFDGTTSHAVNEGDATLDADVGAIEVGRADVTLDASVFLTAHVGVALFAIAGVDLHAKASPVVAHLAVGLPGWSVALSAQVTGGLGFTLPLLNLTPFSFSFGTFDYPYYTGSGTF